MSSSLLMMEIAAGGGGKIFPLPLAPALSMQFLRTDLLYLPESPRSNLILVRFCSLIVEHRPCSCR